MLHTLFQYLTPSKGEFFKSAKRESYFFCLKKIPSKFRGGVIIENFGLHQFWKKESKMDFSLGYQRRPHLFQRNGKAAPPFLIQYLTPSKGQFSKVRQESPTFSVLKKFPPNFMGVIIENFGPHQFWKEESKTGFPYDFWLFFSKLMWPKIFNNKPPMKFGGNFFKTEKVGLSFRTFEKFPLWRGQILNQRWWGRLSICLKLGGAAFGILGKILVFDSFFQNWCGPKFSIINPPRNLEFEIW